MFFRNNILGILWILFILLLCGLPGNDFPDLSFWSLLSFDKAAHAFVFAVLVVVLTVGFIKQYRFRWLRFRALEFSFGFAIFYSALTEYLQGVIFLNRSADIMDFTANIIGSLLGVLMFKMIYRGVRFTK